MKSNAREYLRNVCLNKYTVDMLEKDHELVEQVNSSNQKIKVVSKNGFLIQVTDNRDAYYSKLNSRMGTLCE